MRARASAFAAMVAATLASFAAVTSFAQTAPLDAGAAAAPAVAPATSASASAEAQTGGCVENLPTGSVRPKLGESFPTRGTSGYAAVLTIDIEHGRGENVLPNGLSLQSAGEAGKALKTAGFVLPDQDGGAAARLVRDEAATGDRVKTRLELPLVPLPPEPGRHTLTLPPLPVAIARASGEIATVCTQPHAIRVEDPTASTPEAKPQPNPVPLQQREEWTALKKAVIYGAIGLVVGAIVALLVYRWLKRPRPAPPPPPPRPPWEVALEKLDEVRHAGLLDVQRYSDYYDRVSDAVRMYLGARFDFDGLESTSDEVRTHLKRARIAMPDLPVDLINGFLADCDLVKFARMTPTPEDCARSLVNGEAIVRATMPRVAPPRQVTQQPPPNDPGTSFPSTDAPAPPSDAKPDTTEIRG